MTHIEKMMHFMKKPWVIILYAILVVLVYFFIDKPLATYFHQLDLRGSIHALNVLTAFGKWKIYILLFLLTGLYFRYVQKKVLYEKYSWYLLGCILIPNICGFIIKIFFSRARPDLLFESNFFGFHWFQLKDMYWSFPSGHTITITALAAGLGVLLPRYFYAFIIFAFLVALSRVLLYHHYLSDVMTGFYLSMLVVGLWTELLTRKGYLNEIK